MISEFQKIYMENIFKILSEKLKKISEKHLLNYEDLENNYLHDIKTFIENN